jgi:hypothetical protein
MGPALDALSAIIDLSLAFGVKTKILFRPSLSRNAEVSLALLKFKP